MRVSENDIVLSDCVSDLPCLYDKRGPKYHQRDVTGNCLKKVANNCDDACLILPLLHQLAIISCLDRHFEIIEILIKSCFCLRKIYGFNDVPTKLLFEKFEKKYMA